MRTVKESINRLEQKYGGSVPLLSPSSDLKISSSKYKKLQSKLRKLEDMLQANCLHGKYATLHSLSTVSALLYACLVLSQLCVLLGVACLVFACVLAVRFIAFSLLLWHHLAALPKWNADCSAHDRTAKLKSFMHYENIVKVQDKIAAQVKDAEGLVLKKDLQQRLRVLRRLQYVTDSGIVLQKGHVRSFCYLNFCCTGSACNFERALLHWLVCSIDLLVLHGRNRMPCREPFSTRWDGTVCLVRRLCTTSLPFRKAEFCYICIIS